MSYRCILVDDNLLERDDLESQLRKIPRLEIVGVAENGLEASAMLASNPVDIVFTDIDMPGLNGLSLVRSLRKRPAIIIITAHPEYAIQGFELDVVDFVAKPVMFERLLQSVEKAGDYIRMQGMKQAAAVTDSNDDRDNYFFIREATSLTRLQFQDVAYIESKGDFSKVHTLQDKSHLTLVSLKNLEASLPSTTFLRVHKQYIINLSLISTIGQEELVLDGRFTVPLSASFRQTLLDKVVDRKLISRTGGKQ
jgi:DNA-binding LytR/AlgR family response regulator